MSTLRLQVNGSSACSSLDQAFMAINLTATLKGLTTKLLDYANVTILPSTGVQNDLVSTLAREIAEMH